VETTLNPLRSRLTLTYLSLFLINIFLNSKSISYILAIIAVCLLFTNLPFLTSINKFVSLLLLISGIFLLRSADADLGLWVNALTKNTSLICLLISVPLLGIPLDFENFRQALAQNVKKYLDKPQSFYLITNILTYSICTLLNIAGITIIYQLLNQVSLKYPRRLFITALTRGYGCGVFWSPNLVSVAVILHYLELSWIQIAPWGFLFAGISILVAYLSQKVEYSTLIKECNAMVKAEINPKDKEATKLLRKLVVLGLFLLILIMFMEDFTGQSVVVLVPLVSVIFPFIAALLWRKMSVYYHSLKDYYRETLPNSKNEFVLFTAAGFFGQALIEAGVGDFLAEAIIASNIEQGYIYIIVIISLMASLSVIGIHPLVTGTTIALTIPVSLLPLMPIQYALTLLTGWTLAIILSPFSGTVLLTSAISSETPFKVGVGWNWRYALILIAVYSVLLSFFKI
jgi:hypothetical protein